MLDKKMDYKKEYRDLYLPPQKPIFIQVPKIAFIQVTGKGGPYVSDYPQALELLYSLAYTIKMSKKSGHFLADYVEYVVPPLEGLWWTDEFAADIYQDKSQLNFISMIRQPEFVTKDVFDWARFEATKKKSELDFSNVQFTKFNEGDCVQMLHLGSYDEETASIKQLHDFIQENGCQDETGLNRKHHEIYLNDPRKTAVEKLKTIIRLPISKQPII